MYVLWLSFFYHNSSACLLKDGKIVAAAEEERFSRLKNDASFPREAVDFCLDAAGLNIDEIDCVAFYEKPFLKMERTVVSHIRNWPKAIFSFPAILESSLLKTLRVPSAIRKETGYRGDVVFVKHHEAHAASAFFTSPFGESAIVTVDGAGEWDTTAISRGGARSVEMLESVAFPDSLGLLYSAFTQYLGFDVNEGEYKVMGLAPYGVPRFRDAILKNVVTLHPDGSYRLNREYFRYEYSDSMIDEKAFERLFGIPKRTSDEPLEQTHSDIAASIQSVLEEAMLGICRRAKETTGSENLCLAGGVALNCVANSKILESGIFKNCWIFPASGDAGWAVGAALFAWHSLLGNDRSDVSEIENVFWGPEYDDSDIRDYLERTDVPYRQFNETDLVAEVSALLCDQKVVGWFQGRMEFGPRALGNRSILADPGNAENWKRVNLKIKFRESFRPFAPAILRERMSDFFDFPQVSSPFMLFTARAKTDKLPAVTHVDGSSRIQTVSESGGRFYELLCRFEKDAGIPALVNTSFNVAGSPIVCSPQNAYQCFLKTDMDVLVLGNCVVKK